MKAIHKINHNYFDKIDSEDKAYLLGFFIADGSITYPNSSKHPNSKTVRLQISISDIDKNIVELYKDKVCPTVKITTTFDQNYVKYRKPVCHIKWQSKHMGNTLIERYSIKPKKTFDHLFKFNFELIPYKLIPHFIRGYFDGDGQVSFSIKKRQFTFAIYGTSKSFLTQIGKIISKEFKVEYKVDSTKKESDVPLYLLRFNSFQKRKEFINKLYNWFYKGSNYYLHRKESKFKEYLNTIKGLNTEVRK